jgi:hypothetical protein
MLIAGRIARGGALAFGWVDVRRGAIAALGTGAPPRVPDERHPGLAFASLVKGGDGRVSSPRRRFAVFAGSAWCARRPLWSAG